MARAGFEGGAGFMALDDYYATPEQIQALATALHYLQPVLTTFQLVCRSTHMKL